MPTLNWNATEVLAASSTARGEKDGRENRPVLAASATPEVSDGMNELDPFETPDIVMFP